MIRHTQILLLTGALLAATACVDNTTPPAELDAYQPGEIPVLDCVPELNGRIDSDQLQASIGTPVTYRVSPSGEERAVDLRGQMDGGGTRIWDWTTAHPTDQSLEVVASELTDKWYASEFPGGEFVTLLNADFNWDGIYSNDDSGFYLHGYASAAETPQSQKTLVVYAEPVTLYQFPMEVGKSWSSTGLVQNATIQGIPYAGEDTYETEVDAGGELWLPDLLFTDVLRVNTKVTIDPSIGTSTTQRQVSFFFECFGEIARVTSQEGEEEKEFTTATQMRRLGL